MAGLPPIWVGPRTESTVSSSLKPTQQLTSDLSGYEFPQHIVPTTLWLDIVCWDDSHRRLLLIELTVSFETSFTEAPERKRAKYQELQQRPRAAGYHTSTITLEVWSRGMINLSGFQSLKRAEGQRPVIQRHVTHNFTGDHWCLP